MTDPNKIVPIIFRRNPTKRDLEVEELERRRGQLLGEIQDLMTAAEHATSLQVLRELWVEVGEKEDELEEVRRQLNQ